MKKEFILSIAISLTFLSLGFLLLHYGLIGYGLSFFVFLPFILGYVLGNSAVRIFSLYGLVISLVIFFILLLANGIEGMVCILMALPLVIVAILLGRAVKRFIQRNNKKDKTDETDDIIKSSIVPFFFFLGLGFIEKELTKSDKEIISIQTEMTIPYSTTEVYETIKSVDTLIADKPFLMKLDLPIPQKCILEKEEVGGLRTCYFSGGTITERITELEKAKVLRMDVIDYKLTGRKWLGFKEAIYYFDKVDENSSKITRITTYTSVLKPRFYWQPLEKMGISQEHDYVFDNLKNDLKRKYGR
jgi:hypothetical protein